MFSNKGDANTAEHRHRWNSNIRMALTETGCVSGLGAVASSRGYVKELSGFTGGEEADARRGYNSFSRTKSAPCVSWLGNKLQQGERDLK
jgi:hypothetical protein